MTSRPSSKRSNRSFRVPSGNAVGVRLGLEPPGAEAENETATRDVVERDRRVGRDRGMAVVHAVDHAAEPQSLGRLGQRGQHRPALQVRAVEREE